MTKGRSKASEPKPIAGQKAASADTSDDDAVAIGRAILLEIAGTLWLPEGLSKEERTQQVKMALGRIEGVNPNGAVEGMLAEQMVGTHSAAMECLRRAMLPNQTFEGREQNLRHAAKLLSLYTRQVEVLDKHRGKGQQKVTVEHVHVEAGGQAIVGNVETSGAKRRRRRKAAGPAIEHTPEAPLETPAPAAAQRRKGKG